MSLPASGSPSREQPRPSPEPAAATLPVGASWLAQLTAGERITLVDARDAKREITVTAVDAGGAWAEATQTAYVVPGTPLVRERWCAGPQRRTHVEDLPATAQSIALAVGDTLILTKEAAPGHPAVRDENGTVVSPARIGVTLPDALTTSSLARRSGSMTAGSAA